MRSKLPGLEAQPQPPSPRTAAEQPTFAGARTRLRPWDQRAQAQTPKAPWAGPPEPPPRETWRVRTASPAPPQRQRGRGRGAAGGPQPSAPAILPGSQIATRPHLPTHGPNKRVAPGIARAGVGASLRRFPKSVDNNVLAFEGSRHVENHASSLLRAESRREDPSVRAPPVPGDVPRGTLGNVVFLLHTSRLFRLTLFLTNQSPCVFLVSFFIPQSLCKRIIKKRQH